MLAGRKRVPGAIKELNGNPGKRPIQKEPDFPGGIPDCPEHLDAVARAEWNRIAPMLNEAGVLKLTDRAVLAGYCAAWSRWVTANIQVQSGGLTITASTGTVIQSPWLNIETCALTQLIRYEDALGLTPMSRSRVSVGEGKKKPEDALAAWKEASAKPLREAVQ